MLQKMNLVFVCSFICVLAGCLKFQSEPIAERRPQSNSVAVSESKSKLVKNSKDEVDDSQSAWGKLSDPEGDTKIVTDNEALSMRLGEGRRTLTIERDEALTAPFLWQKFDGDFAMEVTVDGLPLPKKSKGTAYLAGGFLIKQNDKNYIRFERAAFTQRGKRRYYINFERRVDGKLLRRGGFGDFPLKEDKRIQLRFEVKDSVVRALVRYKGDDWHKIGTAKLYGSSKIQAGVSASKTDKPEATIIFRDFKTKKEFVRAAADSSSNIVLDAKK